MFTTICSAYLPPTLRWIGGLLLACLLFSCLTTAGFANGMDTAATDPFITLIPSADGTAMTIEVNGTQQTGVTFFANVGVGPTGDKRPYTGFYTMTYSETKGSYLAEVIGFTPRVNEANTLNITSTQGLTTSLVQFNRAYVPMATAQFVRSSDGNFAIDWINPNTLPFDTYLSIVSNVTPPGPPEPGHLLVGKSYSVRTPAALVEADKPMILRLYYPDPLPPNMDAHTLAIFAWDAFAQRWVKLGGQHFANERYLSVGSQRFTTYALLSTPTWRDDFSDALGLAMLENVVVGSQTGQPALLLVRTPGSGSALSTPITPSLAAWQWGTLTYSATQSPPTTTVQVDLLDANGALLLGDVNSGADLSAIDPRQHPALRLRLTLTSALTNSTPSLSGWQLTWQPPTAAPTTTLHISIPTVTQNGIFTVPVEAVNLPSGSLAAATVAVRYNPTVITPLDCTADPTGQFALAFCNPAFEQDGGEQDAVGFTLAAGIPISRNVTLAHLRFRAIGPVGTQSSLVATTTTFVDATGAPIPVSQPASAFTIAAGLLGDVNCDNQVNVVDAAFVLQFGIGLRSGGESCPPAPGALYLPHCNVNGDSACNVLDALVLVQCEVGMANAFCPASPMQLTLGAAMAAAPPPGQTTLVIRAQAVAASGLGAVTLDVAYDPAQLRQPVCLVDPQDRFAAGYCNATYEADGIAPDYIRFSLAADVVVTGNVELATLHFQAQPGSIAANVLTLIPRTLTDGDGMPVAAVTEWRATGAASQQLYLAQIQRQR